MRGTEEAQDAMFSYISAGQRVPKHHPLRPIRRIMDEVLKRLSPEFGQRYSTTGRPSIAPERLLRAVVLQAIFTVQSERIKAQVSTATATAERDSAVEMIREISRSGRITVGAHKASDTKHFVADLRDFNPTPHVAQNVCRNRTSAIDRRTAFHPG